MKKNIIIHWFRQDLRLIDNPGLHEASRLGTVLPIYILDDVNAKEMRMGGASRWWLHYSLQSLSKKIDGQLSVYQGDPKKILKDLANRFSVKAVHWNRCYEPWRITRDQEIKKALQANQIEVNSFNGSLLWEPWEILKRDATPYRVFTPYYRRGCLEAMPPRAPLLKPKPLHFIKDSSNRLTIDDLKLLPTIRWDKKIEPHWKIGEEGAKQNLKQFFNQGIKQYKNGRDFPAQQNVSRLSPYLHWGEISPNQVWYGAKENGEGKNLDHFLSELGWREFSYYLLYHFPDLPQKNLQPKFNQFPWVKNKAYLKRWQRGQTGYPFIDAGMRELWQTGYIHNRVRMVVGSFLVKNLLLHWHDGRDWFWDCLVDADLASNSASWQWVAGCGADAAPYFRIFNPVTQGHKFDPEGEYTRCFVPELAKLPLKYLFNPWEAPQDILKDAGIKLGQNYPKPIVDLKFSRERALKAYEKIRG